MDEPVLSQDAAQVDGRMPAATEARATLGQLGRLALVTCWAAAAALLLFGSAGATAKTGAGGVAAPPLRGLSEMLDGWAPARISAASDPKRCWKVGAEKGTYENGMPLIIWDCKDADTFIISRSGFGPIRPSQASDYCLVNAKKRKKMHFWLCSEASPESARFYLPPHKGFIRPVGGTEACVDVVGGIKKNGHKMQVFQCSRKKKNELFVIHWPFDCKWTPWTEWSVCSTACKTWRSRRENPAEETTDPLALWSTQRSCSGVEEEVWGCRRGRCQTNAVQQPPLVANSSEQQPRLPPVTTESPYYQPVRNSIAGAANDRLVGSAFKQQAFGQVHVRSANPYQPPAPVGQTTEVNSEEGFAERLARQVAAQERLRRQGAAV